jgi:site-specific DNA recombinase
MNSIVASVAIYARVSSQRQAQTHTIASQLAALRERVQFDGLACNDALCFVDDGASGSTLLRPALERLRDAAYAGLCDRLYVHSPDRLARKFAHQMLLLEEFQRCGIEVVFLNRAIGDSAEDQLLVQVQGVVAEYERAKIQERSRRGKRHSAARGAVSVFSTAPYGYRYVPKTPDAPARFEILPHEARVVERIFEWVGRDRCSMREVCRRLEKQRISTRSGRAVWEPATIAGLLKNPAYCGRAAYGKTRVGERRPRLRPQRGRPAVPRRLGVSRPRPREEWIEVAVPALIAPPLFDSVAEQLRENRQRARARPSGTGHLLQGLVVCQCCGYACYGQSARAAAGRARYGYYRCIGNDRRRGDGQRVCHNPTLPRVPLETAVWHDVRALLADPTRVAAEFERRLHDDAPPTQRAHAELDLRRQRVQRGITRLIDGYTEGLLEKTEFEPRLRESKRRLNELDAEAKVLAERESREQELNVVIGHLQDFSQRVQDGLAAADSAVRRELIRALVKRVELGVNEIRIVYRIDLHPFDPSPSGGNLRHCVRCQVAALQSPRDEF